MVYPLAPAYLHHCELPAAWANQNAWRVLDTHLADGLNFLAAWAAWQADPQRPRLLHYVAIAPDALDPRQLAKVLALRCDDAASAPSGHPTGFAGLVRLLADQCFGLLPGFHRLEFEQGRVVLTLCIGDLKAMLREQRFLADSLFLVSPDSKPGSNPDVPSWDPWTVKSLARCCHRGTRVAYGQMAPALHQALSQSGFELRQAAPLDGHSEAICSGIYNSGWEPKTSRIRSVMQAQPPESCVVIGAGLAGASVAQALARRGWKVQVLDAASAPAAGASGLPVGLMAPHVSADDSPRSRLSRAGIRLMLNQARALLVQGQDWDATGVLERRPGGLSGLPPTWPAQGLAWSQPANNLLADAPWGTGLPRPAPALWHARAAWIKPARLIKAWLAQPGVQFQGSACVARIRREGNVWVLLDATHNVLASAKIVVLAAAGGTTQLLNQLHTDLCKDRAIERGMDSDTESNMDSGSRPNDRASALASALPHVPTLHAVSGQISWAMQRPADTAALPPYPVNGLGSLVAHVPVRDLMVAGPAGNATDGTAGGMAWFTGATYETPWAAGPPSIAAQHRANHARLQALLPECARTLADQFEDGSVQAWRNVRHAPADRLPVVGPLMGGDSPTLWISTGLGSRGLSLSVLCAELLAARLGAEPLPIEATLARFLDSTRSKVPLAPAKYA